MSWNALELSLLASWIIWWLWIRLGRSLTIDNLRGPPAPSLLTGHLKQIYSPRALPFYLDISQEYGDIVLLRGLFGARELFVSDPKAMYEISVKDASKWTFIPLQYESNKILFGPGIITSIGDQHKKQRKILHSSFTKAHIQSLSPIFFHVAKQLRSAISTRADNNTVKFDMLHWTTRAALELIGQSGLGYSFDELNSDKRNPYAEAVKNLLPTTFRLSPAMIFLPLINRVGTPKFRRFLTYIIPWPVIHRLREMVDVMEETSLRVLHKKQRDFEKGDPLLQEQVAAGKDIISALLRANTLASEAERLSESELLAQMTSLIFAAMDTTSSALSRTLHILAEKPDIQERIRAEVLAARRTQPGEHLSCDELQSLQYLDAVVKEVLRLHAPVSRISRMATENVILPLSKPAIGKDGTQIQEIFVPAGTVTHIGLLAANTSRKMWGEDALEFKPERWLSPLPDSVIDAKSPGVFSHLMTFWAGGRSCLGKNFAELQMKVVLSLLLESFRFSLPEEKIIWHMSSIQVPTIDDVKVGLPLKVEKI